MGLTRSKSALKLKLTYFLVAGLTLRIRVSYSSLKKPVFLRLNEIGYCAH
ncbi:hypothetical protein HanRHA438_Chr02g0053031 [Helianthus annuus]|nr:hypothetical protein HanRHA438_Chr02g0053031 [Helianthus annuus]